MLNVCIIGYTESTINALCFNKELKERIKCLFTWRSEKSVKNICNKIFYIDDLWTRIPNSSGNINSDSKLIAKYKSQIIYMYDRVDPKDKMTEKDRIKNFCKQLSFYDKLVSDLELDHLIFTAPPHRIFDFALYLVGLSQEKKITILNSLHTPIGTCTILTSNNQVFEITNRINKNDYVSSVIRNSIINWNLDAITSKGAEYFYMKKQRETMKNSIPKYIMNGIGKFKFIFNYRKWKYIIKPNTYWVADNEGKKTLNWFQFLIYKKEKIKKLKDLSAHYDAISKREIPKNYWFFALNYQPEETTCPAAGVFVNQYEAVKKTHQQLPKGYVLVVKEHPSQFHPKMEGDRSNRIRLYDDILSLPNTKFVCQTISSTTLLRGAKAVFTTNGTIAFEAMCNRKHVVNFGRAWFNLYDMIHQFKNDDALSEYLRKKIDYDSFEKTTRLIASNSFMSTLYKSATLMRSADVDEIEEQHAMLNAITGK